MIQHDKYQHAMHTLHRVLIHARFIAYEQGAEDLAQLLDEIEILPKYIADPARDETSNFRIALEGLAQTHPRCSQLLADFDQDTPPEW